MADIRARAILLAIVFAAGAMVMSGCMLLESNFKIHPDGSTDTKIRLGMSKALVKMQEDEKEDPFADVLEDMKDKKHWQAKNFEDDKWRGVVVTGHVPAGKSLFPDVDEQKPSPDMKLKIIRRLFSTEYIVDTEMQPAQVGVAGGAGAEARRRRRAAVVFTNSAEKQPQGFDEETMKNLIGGMGQSPRISFTIDPPGKITETNGKLVDEGRAEWSVDMDALMEDEQPQAITLHVESRLLNQQNIGRLADKLAADRGLDNMAALIAEYVQAGLLPNPPRDDPDSATLNAAAYDCAISTIVKLEDALGEQVTKQVIQGLDLNADDVTADRLRSTWRTVREIQPERLIEAGGQTAIKHIETLNE